MNNWKKELEKSDWYILRNWTTLTEHKNIIEFIENLLEETKKEAFNDWVKYAVDYKVTFIDENTDLEDLDME